MKPENREEPRKEPYTKPELLVHGSVKEITRDVSGNPNDGVMGGSQLGTGPP